MSPADVTLDVGSKEPLRIELGAHSGRTFIALRYWYLDRTTGNLMPSRRGVNVPAHAIVEIIEALQGIHAQMQADGAFPTSHDGTGKAKFKNVYPDRF